jgi:hypothetical protein
MVAAPCVESLRDITFRTVMFARPCTVISNAVDRTPVAGRPAELGFCRCPCGRNLWANPCGPCSHSVCGHLAVDTVDAPLRGATATGSRSRTAEALPTDHAARVRPG